MHGMKIILEFQDFEYFSTARTSNNKKRPILWACLRARINAERILNRIDSNRHFFFMNGHKVDSISWENKNTRLWVLSIGKPRIVVEIL